MAVNDIKVLKHGGPIREYRTEDRSVSGLSATIKPGEPVKVGGTGNNFVTLLADGDPAAGTDEFVGIAFEESDEGDTAAGTSHGNVRVCTIIPVETVLRGDANTSTNMDTAAELNGIIGDWVTFNYDSTNFTINEDETSDPNVHGLKIIDGDINDGTLDVIVSGQATEAAPSW